MKDLNQWLEAFQASVAADDAFQAAVVRQFGRKRAGDMRYASNLHNAETASAREAYRAASTLLHEISVQRRNAAA